MRKLIVMAGQIAAAYLSSVGGAIAGPWEDGMAAYNRGDYVPALQLFRPLAQTGNAKAQALIGVMYRRGEGVARSPAHAFVWLKLAADHGDRKARVELRRVTQSMTPEDMSRARAMMQACEASNYRDCEY